MSAVVDAKNTVLIVSNDATAAALLGGMVEMLGYRVRFARSEDTGEMVRRVRPSVALLDCETDCEESSIARTSMRGVSVVLVGPRPLLTSMREVAERHGAELAFLPPDAGPLGEVLARAARRSV